MGRSTGKRGRDEVGGLDTVGDVKRATGMSSKILFVQQMPNQVTSSTLKQLFQAVPGFVEVRVPPGETYKGSAFIEFLDDVSANMAMKQLNGFPITATDKLQLTFSQ